MKYARINNTDLKGSKLVLGTALFGTAIDENTSFSLLDRFFEGGGNIIDTASVYADWMPGEKHKSEKTIGKWLQLSQNRKDVIIATKGGHYDLETRRPRLTYKEVREDLEKSFENLRTDYLDIYYLHKDDIAQEPEELIEMFNEAVKGFDVRYLGVSNWCFDRIERANDYAEAHGLKPIIASQIQHSIAKVNTTPEDIFVMNDYEFSRYSQSDLNVFCYSTQAKGLFSVMEEKGADNLPEHLKKEFLNDHNVRLFEKLKKLSAAKGVPISSLVLAALVSDERISSFAQIGTGSREHLDEAINAMSVSLSESEKEFLFDKN